MAIGKFRKYMGGISGASICILPSLQLGFYNCLIYMPIYFIICLDVCRLGEDFT